MRPLTTNRGKVDFRKRASLKGRALETVKFNILDRLEAYLEREWGIARPLRKP
jgi:hypothetical protein